jgi:hypothetical protein
MRPRPDEPTEAWGVLNPAVVRGRDGELYLFPRAVAEGNYSRVGVARVLCDEHRRPLAIERLGFALEPTTAYELERWGRGLRGPAHHFRTSARPLSHDVHEFRTDRSTRGRRGFPRPVPLGTAGSHRVRRGGRHTLRRLREQRRVLLPGAGRGAGWNSLVRVHAPPHDRPRRGPQPVHGLARSPIEHVGLIHSGLGGTPCPSAH